VSWRVAGIVVLGWTVVGLVSGAQASLAAALQGQPAAPLFAAIGDALRHQFLPWIPATLVAVALAERWPPTRGTWSRRLWIHALAIPATAVLTNVLVVASYWVRQGTFRGPMALLEQAAFWSLMRLHVATLVYVATVASTVGIRSWQRLQHRQLELARLEAQLANARLQVLSAQIRPHFLFNTLHAIGQLWRSGRSREADALLDHLGALFQRVIATTSRPLVPLAEELAMVRDYLAIERARFGERVGHEIAASSSALSCLVPPLLLQPIVENAVKHGLSLTPRGGTVRVEAGVDGERLMLRVCDDGAGPGGAVAPPETAGTGTGLRNVRERLAVLYGARFRLDIAPGQGGGTEVSLELPRSAETQSSA